MNIKSLLLGSAAALAAVSGAQAADAIVAAEPEPMEYVRVCDAFGTGYFYIPGTETCLKIGGYVRFEVGFGEDAYDPNGDLPGGDDWDSFTRAQLDVTAKSDTELGTLTSVASLRFEYGDDTLYSSNANTVYINEAYIQLGGFRVGRWLNWWDANDLPGELDNLGSNRLNSIQYVYTGSAFTAGIQVDELSRAIGDGGQNVGIEAIVQAAIGPAKIELLGSYDFSAEDGAIRAIGSVAVGPGTFYLSGVWSSGDNAYYGVTDTGAGEAAVAVAYSFKATDKLEIIPEAQYIWNTEADADGDFFGDDAWGAGVTVNYQIVENFAAKVAVNYVEVGDEDGTVQGIVRLQRDF